jgi:peptide/nickel transport system substrate-binding protein
MIVAVLAALLTATASAAEGTLRVASPGPIYAFAHPYTRDEGGGVRDAIYDTLTRISTAGRLEPGLAESWEVVSPLTWRFRLRPGVVFSNGAPFDATTVVRAFALLRAPGAIGQLPRAAELATVAGVMAVDAMTVEIRTTEPDPLLARRLNMLAIVEPEAWSAMGVDAYIRAPVGTGPYRVRRWRDGGSGVTLEAWPSAWRRARDVKTIEMTVVLDPAARIRSLLSGQVDVAPSLAPDDIEAIRAAGYVVRIGGINSVLSIAYRNVRDDAAPLKDVRVRQALNFAVDKQAIVDEILAGTTRIATQGSASGLPGHDPGIAPVPYDPARAKALLTEAGHGDGFELTIAVYGGALPNDSLIFQKMAQDLGDVGVRVTLRAMAFPDYVRRLFDGDWSGIDAFSNGWLGSGLGDPIRAVDQFSCGFQAAFFCAPEVMPAIAATRTEMDPDRRAGLMRQVMRELNRVGVALWLVEFPSLTGLAPHIQNYDTRDAIISFENITFMPRN